MQWCLSLDMQTANNLGTLSASEQDVKKAMQKANKKDIQKEYKMDMWEDSKKASKKDRWSALKEAMIEAIGKAMKRGFSGLRKKLKKFIIIVWTTIII